LATLFLGCGLCISSTGPAAGIAEKQQPAAREAAKKRHRVLGEIPFSYSYDQTLSLARKNGKPIFAYFTFET
jgi:hypothetical protein